MPYGETKVYFDGSHYIAIPHTIRPSRPRRQTVDEVITVADNPEILDRGVTSSEDTPMSDTTKTEVQDTEMIETEPQKQENTKPQQQMTKKELFDELYRSSMELPKHARKKMLMDGMRPYFHTEFATENFVINNLDRKMRNLIARRIRLTRKANLQEFNYFVTFTYDSQLHDEDSFRKKLKRNLSNNCDRKGWKYIGVWERSPERRRLHFHGIFHIPDGMMQGELIEVKDYSFITHKMQVTLQNTHFNTKYGRSDFETLDDKRRIGDAIAYLLKYIEKTGEKLVYSRGLPQYFISDIMDDDIVCPIGMEDKKLLLFDDFTCWDKGECIGNVSPETIQQLRKSN